MRPLNSVNPAVSGRFDRGCGHGAASLLFKPSSRAVFPHGSSKFPERRGVPTVAATDECRQPCRGTRLWSDRHSTRDAPVPDGEQARGRAGGQSPCCSQAACWIWQVAHLNIWRTPGRRLVVATPAHHALVPLLPGAFLIGRPRYQLASFAGAVEWARSECDVGLPYRVSVLWAWSARGF